jgi:hypothetical protein
MHQFDERLRQAHGIERHLLAHGERSGVVVQSEGEKLHERNPRGSLAIISPGSTNSARPARASSGFA